MFGLTLPPEAMPWMARLILAVYFIGLVLAEFLSNNAVAVMFSATLAFATPIGYQTNMMVYGPGGYRFTDYVKVGVPLNILIMLVISALIPLLWPLNGAR